MNFPKGIPLIVMAGVIGVVASFSVYGYVTTKIAASVKPTSQVVVASNEIAPGTAISTSQVKVVAWPRELIPAKATTSINAIQGRVVILPIAKGEPVLLTKLAPEGSGSGLGSLLSETKRAFTVRVDDVSGVAGFIKPGDHVDVGGVADEGRQGVLFQSHLAEHCGFDGRPYVGGDLRYKR